jgi:hypothetical protein
MATNDQWLILTHVERLEVCNLGSSVTAEQVEDYGRRARILAGVPAEDDTAGIVTVAPGEPHAQTMLRAFLRPLSALMEVSQSAVSTYRARQAAARRKVLEEAREAVERDLKAVKD